MQVADRRGGANCCGVFVGIIALVLTVISVSVSLVLSSNHIVQLTQLVLSVSASLTCVVTAVQLCRLRGPRRRPAATSRQHGGSILLDVLLLSSVAGVVATACLDAVAAHDAALEQPRTTVDVTLVVSVVVIVQSVLQTSTVAVALRRQPRPVWSSGWRQSLALLVACNVSQWLIDVVRCAALTTSHDALWAHSELTYRSVVHVCAPLAVFHRFVIVVCLLVMWKRPDFQSFSTTQL